MGSSEVRFRNRQQAGELLAKKLTHYQHNIDVAVMALPRGGVPVGYALATKLEVRLDILSVRKLGVPGREELAMGAIAQGGMCVLKAEIVEICNIPTEVIEAIAHRELREIERREKLYRVGRKPLQIQDKIIILVDDGLATGASMLVAIKALRKERPAKIIVAVPVASPDSCREIETEADEFVCLKTPQVFQSVGEWYGDFTQVTDAEVTDLLTEADRSQLYLDHAELIPPPHEENNTSRKGQRHMR
jgi:putative phosphoribosyl transferase